MRYCRTKIAKLIACQVGWGQTGTSGSAWCTDDPEEKNCRNIVIDENDALQKIIPWAEVKKAGGL